MTSRPRRRILSSSSTAAAVTPPLAPSAALTYDGLLSACRQIAKDDPKLDGFNIAIGPHVRGLAELRQDPRYLAAVRAGHLHDESGIIRVSKDALKPTQAEVESFRDQTMLSLKARGLATAAGLNELARRRLFPESEERPLRPLMQEAVERGLKGDT